MQLQGWKPAAQKEKSLWKIYTIRSLYTDSDEVLFSAMRACILNGIEDIVTRPDLIDRAILITLAAIPDEKRRQEEKIWAEFDAAHPAILGALLDAVAHGVKELPTELKGLPRMADFALWITACEGALWGEGTFMAAYVGNQSDAVEIAIEGDVLAAAVRAMMTGTRVPDGMTRTDNTATWAGTASELLKALEADPANERPMRAKGWPADATRLGYEAAAVRACLAQGRDHLHGTEMRWSHR